MSGRAAAVAAGAMIALSGLSACGSDSLSLRDLRTRATAVCTAADRGAGRIASPTSPALTAGFIRAGIRNLTQELSGLRSATPPSGSTGDYQQAVGALSQIVDALRGAQGQLASGGDPVLVVRQLERRVAPLRERADAGWRALAVQACR